MDLPEADLETVLVDLTDLPISAIAGYDVGDFGPSVKVILSQVDRPRKNIGTGNPGRVD